MRWITIGGLGLVLTGCSPAMIAQMLPAQNPYTDPADYAHLWYQCHPGELEAKREQCAHLADPTRDQGCALAYGAMDVPPQPSATPIIEGPLVLNVGQARCNRYGNGPPPPSYAGNPAYPAAGPAYGGIGQGATGTAYPGSAYGYQAGRYGAAPPPAPYGS